MTRRPGMRTSGCGSSGRSWRAVSSLRVHAQLGARRSSQARRTCDRFGAAQALFSGSTAEQEFLRHYYSSQALVLERQSRRLAGSAGQAQTCFSRVSQSGGRIQRDHCCQDDRGARGMAACRAGASAGVGRGRIRVDPAERPCLIQIAGVLLRRAVDGARALRDWTHGWRDSGVLAECRSGAASRRRWTRFLSTGGDPQLLLPEIDHALADQPLIFEARVRIAEDLAPAVSLLRSAMRRSSPTSQPTARRSKRPFRPKLPSARRRSRRRARRWRNGTRP